MKKALVCIHGFKTGSYHDFDVFKRHVDKKHPDVEVILLNYYDPFNKETQKSELFLESVKTQVQKITAKYDDVTLLGYSMGGPMSLMPWSQDVKGIDRVVLLSPTFNLGKLGVLKLTWYSIRNYWKAKKRKKGTIRVESKDTRRARPFKIIRCFTGFKKKKYERYIYNWEKFNEKKILFINVHDDEFLPRKMVSWGWDRIESSKKEEIIFEAIGHTWVFSPTYRSKFDEIVKWVKEN